MIFVTVRFRSLVWELGLENLAAWGSLESWTTLESFWEHLEALGISGTLKYLEVSGRPPGASGSLWKHSGASGSLWELLGGTGGTWGHLGASVPSKPNLRQFEKLKNWKISKHVWPQFENLKIWKTSFKFSNFQIGAIHALKSFNFSIFQIVEDLAYLAQRLLDAPRCHQCPPEALRDCQRLQNASRGFQRLPEASQILPDTWGSQRSLALPDAPKSFLGLSSSLEIPRQPNFPSQVPKPKIWNGRWQKS